MSFEQSFKGEYGEPTKEALDSVRENAIKQGQDPEEAVTKYLETLKRGGGSGAIGEAERRERAAQAEKAIAEQEKASEEGDK